MVETSSITIRNSAVYQQLLCIGQQCHNRLSSIKSAAITNQSFNMIYNSQCQKYNDNQRRNQKHIKIPKKTSAENLGCWHSGTPSWTELRGAGKDNNSEKGEPNLKIPFLSLRYFAYFESENVASFFTYNTPDHKSELNKTSKDSEKLMIGLREHFLLPPSIEVTFAHLFLVN